MTPQQFEALAIKHKGNYMMQQLLREYSEKHKGLYAELEASPKQKTEEFESFIASATSAVLAPDTLQAAMFATGKHTPAACTEEENE